LGGHELFSTLSMLLSAGSLVNWNSHQQR
jgi:hypothetical protein